MTVVASAASRARYWLAVSPPMSMSAGRKVFSVTGVATLPARIRFAAMLVDLLMDRLEEMLRLEEVGDAVERLVVDQDGAEQRLLGLDVVRGAAKVRRCWFRARTCAPY